MKSDPAHTATDAEIAKIEKLIAKEYKKAHKEVSKKLDNYLAAFAAKDAKWKEWVADGTKTEADYKAWKKGQILVGKRWEDLRDQLSEDYTNAAAISQSIAKGYAPEVYALNHNYATFEVEKGSLLDTSYSLYSRESVERMYRENPRLYPKYGKAVAKEIKLGKQHAWDKRRIQSVLMQGIIQGESIPNLTRRLEHVTGGDHKAAIRNARTMMTGVQNAGRTDAYQRALDMGIPVKKQWLATLDMRTRHWHKELDGTAVENDEPFTNEIGDIMFPGDPDADPANVYNCRCTLIAQIKGFEIDTQDTDLRPDDKLGEMSYEEWLDAKSVSNPITLPEEKAAAIQGAWWGKYGGGGGTNTFSAAEGQKIVDEYYAQEAAKIKAELDKLGNKEYTDIWQGKAVKVSEYADMDTPIKVKHYYLDNAIAKAQKKGDAKAVAKYKAQKKSLEEFEKDGKKYLAGGGQKTATAGVKPPKVQSTAKATTGGVQGQQSAVAAPKTEAQAAKAVKDIEAEISALDQKQWPTIWYGGVEPKDYPLKKSKIAEKKAYYQGKIDDAIASGDTAALKKYKPLLKYTEEFEKYGMLWEQKQLELQAAKDALKPFEDAKKAKEAAKAAKEQAKKDAKKAALKADMDILDQKDYDLSFLGFYGDNHVKLADYEKIKKNIKEFKKAYGSSPWFADEMEALTAFENDLKARKKLQAAMDKLGGKKVSPKDAAFVNPDPKKTIAKAKSFSYDYHERNNFDRGIWNALSQKAREGLQKYTGSGYGAMNDVMRGLRRVDARVADLINGATEAVRAFKLKEDTKLWRGMGSKNSLARALQMNPSDIVKMLDNGSIVGQVFTEDGFGSTAATKEKAWDKEIMLEIFAPEGTEAMYVDPVSRNRGEKEILLQRGTRFEIIGVNKETSRWGNERYWLKVVILDQTPKKF